MSDAVSSASPPGGFRTLRAFLANPAGALSLGFMLAVVGLALAAPLLYPRTRWRWWPDR